MMIACEVRPIIMLELAWPHFLHTGETQATHHGCHISYLFFPRHQLDQPYRQPNSPWCAILHLVRDAVFPFALSLADRVRGGYAVSSRRL